MKRFRLKDMDDGAIIKYKNNIERLRRLRGLNMSEEGCHKDSKFKTLYLGDKVMFVTYNF